MSLAHGASVVRNGLVFQYDMSNTAKSWKGKPTTNLIANTGYYAGNTSQFSVEQLSTRRYKVTCLVNAPSTWHYGTQTTLSYTTTGTETCSLSATILERSNSDFVLGVPGFGPISDSGRSGAINERVSRTITYDWGFKLSTDAYNSGSTLVAGDYIIFEDMQIEVGSFATPFVNGTRSNTEALIDLTGNSTLTANNLIYNSNNTFEFDDSINSVINPGKSREVMFPSIDTYSYVCIAKRNGAPSTAHSHAVVFGAQGYNTGLLWHNSDNKVRMGAWYDNAGSWANKVTNAGTTAIADDTWVHLAGTFNAYGNMCCYINGELISAVDVSANTASSGNTWYNGPVSAGGGVSAYQFNGSVPLALGYDRELSAEEIADHFEIVRGRYGI